ncbi:hypothetical protein J6E39_07730 [bacterium]|nr:hypothetical protein [bacterium]
MQTKNLVIYILLLMVLFAAGTLIVSMVKPEMHPAFNIEKLIIKKINK